MYERMVRSASDALTWHRADGAIDFASAGFREVLGHDVDAVRGQHLWDLAHPDDADGVERAQRDLVDRRSRFCISYRLRGADGFYVWVESRSGELIEEDPPGFVVITRDISARRSLLAALEAHQVLADQERRAAERERAFFTTVAHATRTPMTTILGVAALLRDRRHELHEDRVADLIDRLAATARQLGGVLERITTMEGLSSRPAATEGLTCPLRAAVDRALEEVSSPDASVQVDVDDRLTVAASPDDVERIVQLLVTNAVMHTRIGTRIWIGATAADNDAVLTIADDGPGVPDPFKEVIFEPFRSAGSRADYDPGIGLGLSIVARTATRYGGRAWAGDRPGGGAAFNVQLPLAADHGDEQPTSHTG